MEVHKEFTEWAVSRGVKINGIAAHRFPGRGISIIAKKSFEAGETLLSVPTTALRTVHTVPKTISRAIGKITVNGLLSAELALDTSEHRAPWRVVLPTREDFLESVPLMWDSSLQALLPDACQKLLSNQKRKVALDWAAVSKTYSKLSYDLYLYNWLLVNTRTFYFLDAKAKKQPPRDDCSALSPFADYFNHAPHGCNVSFSATGYEITTEKHIPKGAEIYISYGNHSNDFLLAEYGFILPSGTNDWDEISLDAYIIPLFSPTQKKHLEDHGFLGKYVLDKETVCYRAQVALRILCVGLRKWERFVEGMDDGEREQGKVDVLLLSILKRYQDTVLQAMASLEKVETQMVTQRDTIRRRWVQIGELLRNAVDRIEG